MTAPVVVASFPATVTRVEEVTTGSEHILAVAVEVRPEISATRVIGGGPVTFTLSMGEYLAAPCAIGDRLFVTLTRQP